MAKTNRLVLCGSISIDRIMSFSGRFGDHIHPDKLDVLSLSLLMDSLIISPGGIAGNIAYSLSLLGQSSTVVSAIGPDGKTYKAALKKRGVETRYMPVSYLPTSTFTVITDSQGNQIGGFYPGAMADNAKVSLKPWQGTPAFIVISANDPDAMRRQVRECRQYRLPYLYDVSQQVSNIPAEDILTGIKGAEIVIVNAYERDVIEKSTRLTGSSLTGLCPIFITTLGEKGSTLEGRSLSRAVSVAAVSPVKVVDPTGAGDAYRAGFLFGYLRDFPLPVCSMLGSTLASFAIEQPGTQNHRFTKSQFKQRFAKNYQESITI